MPNGNAPQRRKQKRDQERIEASGVNTIKETANAENKATDGNNEKDKERPMFSWFRKMIWPYLSNAAAWTAIFTAVLSIFTIGLYRVADSSNETQRSQGRAFVSYAGLGQVQKIVISGIVSGNPWMGYRLGINLSNSGTTPAKKMLLRFGNKLWPEYDLPGGYDFNSRNTQRCHDNSAKSYTTLQLGVD